MLDTGMPSLDSNAIATDIPVKREELQEDIPTSTEKLDDTDVAATLSEDTANLAGSNTIKGEQLLSELVDSENVNEEDIKSSATTSSTTTSNSSEEDDEETDGKDDSNDEINETIVVNQSAEDDVEELEELLEKRQELQEVIAEKQMQALVDSVGEKLTMADADEERFADEVEKMVSTGNVNEEEDEQEAIEEATQKPFNQEKHSLREDVSSSDEEDDNVEEKDNENEKEKSDNTKNEGLESEWGGIVSLDDKNILTNEIDAYDTLPIDLSNDIAINDILANQGEPVDENAELIDVEQLTSGRVNEESRRLEVLTDIK